MWVHAISHSTSISCSFCVELALSKSVEIAASETYPKDATVVKISMFRKDQLNVNIDGYGCPLVCAAACATDPESMSVLLSAYTLGTRVGVREYHSLTHITILVSPTFSNTTLKHQHTHRYKTWRLPESLDTIRPERSR